MTQGIAQTWTTLSRPRFKLVFCLLDKGMTKLVNPNFNPKIAAPKLPSLNFCHQISAWRTIQRTLPSFTVHEGLLLTQHQKSLLYELFKVQSLNYCLQTVVFKRFSANQTIVIRRPEFANMRDRQ